MTDRRFDWRPGAENPYDSLIADDNKAKAGGALATTTIDPQAAARANVLARRTGLPPETVLRNMPAIEREQANARAVGDIRSNDYLARWYADPNNAAAGQDDTAPLKAISDQFQAFWAKRSAPPKPRTFLQRARDIANTDLLAAVGIGYKSEADRRADYQRDDGWLDRADALADRGTRNIQAGLERLTSVLSPWASIRGETRARAAEFEQTAATPIAGTTTWTALKARPTVGNVLRFGAESTVESLPGMAIAASGLGGVGIFAGSQAGNIGQNRAEANNRRNATARDVLLASPAAIASAALERLGIEATFGNVATRVAQRVATGTAARAGVRVGAAAAGEATTEAAQSAVEYAGGAVGTDQGGSLSEALDQMAQGALAGFFMGGSLRGVHEVGGRLGREVRTLAEARRAQAGGAILDALTENAEASRLRERDPEAFREFIAGQTDGTPVENVYIPAEAIRELNQDYRDDPFWGDYADQIDEALALDGDVVLPTADVAARLAGTDGWNTLRPEARFTPGGMSEAELASLEQQHGEQLEQMQSRIAEQITAAAAAAEPAAQVYQDVRDQLANAGFAPDAADRYAQLWAANREAWANRLNNGTSDSSAPIDTDGAPIPRLLDRILSKLNEINPQLGGKLRAVVLSAKEIADRPANNDGGIAVAGHSGAVINIQRNAPKHQFMEEVRHMIDLLLGGHAISKWIGEDSEMHHRVTDFLNGRKSAGDLAEGARFTDEREIAQALIDQFFRNPELVRETLPDMYEYMVKLGADSYRSAIEAAESEHSAAPASKPKRWSAWSYHQANPVHFRRILPEALSRVQAADGIDVVINAMRRNNEPSSERKRFGPSLLEWISANGGITDPGGDLASMGADRWHRDGAFRRRLLRLNGDERQGALIEGGDRRGQDAVLEAAVEAGYFPELRRDRRQSVDDGGFDDKPDVSVLLDAINAELRGTPRYSDANRTEASATDDIRLAAGELRQMLESRGLDADTASAADIRRALELQQSEVEANADTRGLEQGASSFEDDFWDWLETQPFADDMQVNLNRESDGTYELTNIRVAPDARGGGKASQVMAALTRYADQYGITLRLSPAEDANGDEGLDYDALHDWYERYGFEGGRNMERRPEPRRGLYQTIYHGTPYSFDDFDPDAAAYDGWWFSTNEGTAKAFGLDRAGQPQHNPNNERINVIAAELDNAKVLTVDSWQVARDQGVGDVETWEDVGTILDWGRWQSDVVADAREQGYDAVHFQNVGDDPTGQTSDHFAVINADKARILWRELRQGARGRALFGDNPGAIIDVFSGSDLSTVIHETGHVWLEELARNARQDGAPADVQADWQTVEAWFADNGFPVGEDGFIPTAAHELWARSWERYAMEGKAPSSALRKAFDAFRGWMLTIYRHVANLRAPITDEVRGVFDRMLATEEAIRDERERQNIRALFTDAVQAGMTEAEFAAYQQATGDARSEAFDALLYRTMATIRASRTKAWREEETRVRDEVSAAVNAQPEFRALHFLRTGRWLGEPDRDAVKVKLDRAQLVETYGSDALALLPKGVPPIYGEGGADTDTVAEMVGYSTGDEMVRALMGLEATQRQLREAGDKRQVRQRTIDEQTAEVMADRHGDPLNDGTIEEEALAAIHNDRQGEVIASEVRQLAKRRGDVPTPYRLAREWAQRKIADGKVVDVASRAAVQRYARAAAKASRAAEAAILAGDVDETFRQKQAHMLNHALLVEAKRAADTVDATVERLSKIARRATMKSVDQEYLERAHALLEKFDFRARSQSLLAEQATFAEWAAAQQANGVDVVTPPRLESDGIHYSRLSVEELDGLNASVQQVMHLGRLKQKLLDAKGERDFAEIVNEAVDSAASLRQRPPSDLMEPSWGERFRAGIGSADAALLKMEAVFDWLDGGNANGVFNREAFRPLAEAQDRENDMMAEYMAGFRDLMAAVPKETLRRWSERVSPPELFNRQTGNPFTFSRQQLVSIALNMGNAGNVQRLTDGYGWNEQTVRDVLNRELTEPEWQFVQGAWDLIGKLWPDIAALERRVNGVEPEKVESLKVETPHGTFDGGYYPAIYDSARDLVAERHTGESADLFSTMYIRANTAASATKARSDKVVRPILLDLGVITRHLTETIHDITHREAVMNADKFLSAPRVAAAVDASLGREIRQQFRPWLRGIANNFAMERAGNEGIGKFIAKARANATIIGMGFRVSTIITQIAGYSNSAEYLGPKWIAHGIGAFARNPVEASRFAFERSGELRHRMDTIDRDIGQQLRRLQGRSDTLTAAKRFAFHGIGLMDRVVSVPTWTGAYAKALEAGASEADAIYEGDKAVRMSQGAGSPKDLAGVQRGTGKWGELMKLVVMYYSYVSTVYSRQRTLARDMMGADERKPRDLAKLSARALFLVALPPVLAQILAGRGPQEDEDWGWWTFEQMLAQSLGAIPVVRDLVTPIYDTLAGKRAFDYQLSPIQAAGQSYVDVAKDLRRVADGEDTKRATKNALLAAGYTTGLVPGQIATSAQFFVDLGAGEQDPQTVGEWYRGITTGRTEPAK